MASARLPLAIATVLLLLFCWASPGLVAAQNPQPPDPAPEETAETAEADNADDSQDGDRRGRRNRNGIKPYDEVITDEAESDDGVFTVHRLDDKVFYEIPEAELGKEFLWVSQIARTTEGVGYGGQALGNRVVKWGPARRPDSAEERLVRDRGRCRAPHRTRRRSREQRHDHQGVQHRSALRGRCAGHRSDDAVQPGSPGVQRTDAPAGTRIRPRPVVRRKREGLPREHRGEDDTHLHCPAPVFQPEPPRTPIRRRGMRPGSATVMLHYSMVKLPEKPMQPRLFDERVGYFSVRQIDYGRDEHRSPRRRYITRWRLEKKDPSAEVSDPVTPITYWIDPATPTKWVPLHQAGRRGVAAGVRGGGLQQRDRRARRAHARGGSGLESGGRALLGHPLAAVDGRERLRAARPRPAHRRDPGDRHPVPPQRHELVRDWYFVQVGPLDPRARTLPLPDELMGDLLGYVAAHEVGHTLGFQHNHEGQLALPAREGARSRLGPDHGPHAHVDGLLAVQLRGATRGRYRGRGPDTEDRPVRRLGHEVGLRACPECGESGRRTPTLDAWAREQDDTPWYRFSTPGAQNADPGQLTEAVGDATRSSRPRSD